MIGSDFGRLGIDFWTEVKVLDARNELARGFDQVMYNYLRVLLGNDPW